MQNLEEILLAVRNGDNDAKVDVVANAVSYTHLLNRHIDKEDNVVYPFAKKELSSKTLKKIDNECDDFEKEMVNLGVQDKYIKLLEFLEIKYK